ncbi:MAG: glycyl radical protein [Sedimentisphaerales bacterium]|nr:glycyl radical protein [Sedimentisphaerales bacterium]
MNERVAELRHESVQARPMLSTERAELVTAFYSDGRYDRASSPVMARALLFRELMEKKSIWIGSGELIVGERGERPKATPTYPELCCHSLEDLDAMLHRERQPFAVSDSARQVYAQRIIPFWRGRSMRDRVFGAMTAQWHEAFDAGVFTEFMEQRAPGHAILDDKIYRAGMEDFIEKIETRRQRLDWHGDPQAWRQDQQLQAMRVCAEAIVTFARRHATYARELAQRENDPGRKADLERIAEVCLHVPARAPRDFHEALQAYWFVHLGVITELNVWDSFNPGRLDQHLERFYEAGLRDGALTRDQARELLQCFWIKFNNQPAPPKVGITEEQSGTYQDFALINIGGLRPEDGRDGVNEVSHLLLDVVEEMRLIMPSACVQLSTGSPELFLRRACEVIRAGFGQPSMFNADVILSQQQYQGKSLPDARAGGPSGCVTISAFGKESCTLTGYLSWPKVLELTLHNGRDPRTGRQIGPATGDVSEFDTFDRFFAAYREQLACFVDLKVAGNNVIERLYAQFMPSPFLSLLMDDCIEKAADYHDGGCRYSTTYIQGVGLGTTTDSLAAIRKCVYDDGDVGFADLIAALDSDFAGREELHQHLCRKAPKYGNDDSYADDLARRAFEAYFDVLDGRPNTKGGFYRVNLLPTTVHVYFGSVVGALPNGRRAGGPLSEGISPSQGVDRHGPTAVVRSAACIDHARTGGTLLNLKLHPALLDGDGLAKLAGLIRGYFRLGGHHVQFNVVTADTLRAAQDHPEEHQDLIVRVAGYSDYFVDVGRALQDEIISRTEQHA